MNDYTAHLLRAVLNSERTYLEIGQRAALERGAELAKIVDDNAQIRERIAALTETLTAAGESTEPAAATEVRA